MNIGLIGAENSHAVHFAQVINEKSSYPGYRITHIFGEDAPAQAAKMAETYGLVNCATEEEVLAACDAVVITYRKGSAHYEPTMRALKAGKAVFNDKPFAVTTEQAKEITEYATENNLLLCGGSNLKSLDCWDGVRAKIKPGTTLVLSFPADKDSEYDGYWFYGIHSVEVCLTLFGEDYQGVSSSINGDTIMTNVRYADRQCVILNNPNFSYSRMDAVLYNGDQVEHLSLPLNYPSIGPDEFVGMLKSGKAPHAYPFFVKAVDLVADIIEASK